MGAIVFAVFGFALEHHSHIAMADFKPLFYGARCMLSGCDVYSQEQLQRLYFAEGDEPQSEKLKLRNNVVWSYYPPAAYMLATPLAALPWSLAHILWMTLTAATFLLAAFLMWELGSRSAPKVAGLLIGLFLVSQELLIEVGNAAGMVVALCLIAVWCILRKRFELAGVVCLGVALAVKPHDAGLVWLYFLLAGGVFRKRALQALICTVVLTVPAILWVHHLGPNWMPELHHNLAITSARGAINDPGPTGFDARSYGANTVNLQSAISLFSDDSQVYNPVSFAICGSLLVVWVVIGVRSRFSPSLAPLALAVVSALSILPVYHRQHDASLVMLTVPACALLWSEKRWLGRCALFITACGAIFLSHLSLLYLAIASAPIWTAASGLSGKLLTVLLCRPAPLILLAIAIFYLWVYARRSSGSAQSHQTAASLAHPISTPPTITFDGVG